MTLRRIWPAALAALATAGCGGSSTPTRPTIVVLRPSTTATTTTTTAAPAAKPKPPPPAYPQLLGAATGTGATGFVPVVSWQGQTAAWVARTGSVSVLSFDQRLVELRLHPGTGDPGGSGWRFGPAVTGSERGRLVAAFNGGFKLSTGSGGYMSYGRVGAPLRAGLGSVVTYSDGSSDIGAWHREVPAPGRTIVSVRQNLQPLIDGGAPASNVGCRECWGATLGGVDDPARAGLGITADGRLIWAAGEHLSVSQLATALASAHVVRAVELDINPEWVAGYLYGHRGGAGPLAPVPVLADQHGIAGEFLAPWSRDFFSVEAR